MLGEHFVEAAEDGVTRHTDEDEAIFFIVDRADMIRRFVFHLFDDTLKIFRALFGAAKTVRHSQIHRAIGQCVEHRGLTLV